EGMRLTTGSGTAFPGVRSIACVVSGYDLMFAQQWGAVWKEAIAISLSRFFPQATRVRWIVNLVSETSRVAPAVASGTQFFDEIWVPADFQIHALAASGVHRREVHKIPGALDTDVFHPNVAPIEIEGRRGFCFLTVSQYLPDHQSSQHVEQPANDLAVVWNQGRKAIEVLIRAVVEEFR